MTKPKTTTIKDNKYQHKDEDYTKDNENLLRVKDFTFIENN